MQLHTSVDEMIVGGTADVRSKRMTRKMTRKEERLEERASRCVIFAPRVKQTKREEGEKEDKDDTEISLENSNEKLQESWSPTEETRKEPKDMLGCTKGS